MTSFSQKPCPFTGLKMFCACPNVLRHSKNLIAYSASSKTFVPAQKTVLLQVTKSFVPVQIFLCQTNNSFSYILCQSQKFCAWQKDKLNSVKLIFVPAQKLLKRHQIQSNFGADSKNLDQHKTFWDLWQDKARVSTYDFSILCGILGRHHKCRQLNRPLFLTFFLS